MPGGSRRIASASCFETARPPQLRRTGKSRKLRNTQRMFVLRTFVETRGGPRPSHPCIDVRNTNIRRPFRSSRPLTRRRPGCCLARSVPWILASLVSAFFLGCYDLSKKHALRDNAVLPVLFMSTLCGAVVWTILLIIIQVAPALVPAGLTPELLPLRTHGLIFVKSAIVAASWAFTYFG